MRFIIYFLLFFLSACNQNSNSTENREENIEKVNQTLILELSQMVKEDQNIQNATINKSEEIRDSLLNEMNTIFEKNGKRAMQLFEEYGFLGYDLVGEKGSNDFWIIIQHYDQNISFQEKVLEQMKIEVLKGNASNKKYAYLVDRVCKNKGTKQIYGTQIQYLDDFWIAPQPLQDSLNVNEIRKQIGLKSIEEYLNYTMEIHFKMNEKNYAAAGISEPRAYKVRTKK